jgi:hypothetical protein
VVPLAQASTLMVMVLAFVAPLQALAGIFAFLARDNGAATALTTLGAAWTAIALTVLRTPPRPAPRLPVAPRVLRNRRMPWLGRTCPDNPAGGGHPKILEDICLPPGSGDELVQARGVESRVRIG